MLQIRNHATQLLHLALKEHPELAGIADVVMDFHRSISYPETVRCRPSSLPQESYLTRKVTELEGRLLKPRGTLYRV